MYHCGNMAKGVARAQPWGVGEMYLGSGGWHPSGKKVMFYGKLVFFHLDLTPSPNYFLLDFNVLEKCFPNDLGLYPHHSIFVLSNSIYGAPLATLLKFAHC